MIPLGTFGANTKGLIYTSYSSLSEGQKVAWSLRCRCVSRHSDCGCADQNGMADKANRQNRIASDCDSEGQGPHPSKHLENHMPHIKVRDIA